MDTYKITLTYDAESVLHEVPLDQVLAHYVGLGRARAKPLVADLLRVREVTIHGLSNEEAARAVEKIPPLGARCAMARDECPICGSHVTRILSDWQVMSRQQRALTLSGRAILGPDDGKPTPDCVCLDCAPEWREFHHLAIQNYNLQLSKEQAVAESHFDRARSIRDQQDELRPRLEALLGRVRGRN